MKSNTKLIKKVFKLKKEPTATSWKDVMILFNIVKKHYADVHDAGVIGYLHSFHYDLLNYFSKPGPTKPEDLMNRISDYAAAVNILQLNKI